jgi:hypothetical protein
MTITTNSSISVKAFRRLAVRAVTVPERDHSLTLVALTAVRAATVRERSSGLRCDVIGSPPRNEGI